ncbi:MAG: thioredoxin [Alistipes sp.]|nr:thioredoxin [Rikenellaceae bacterium]MCD8102801.1 thioredoxin [Alistipes sp.]
MALEVTKDNLQELIDSGKPLVIDFWAEWCGPCRMIGPIIEQLADEYGDRVNIGKCNIEENDTVAVKYSIRNIPTILFIKDGEIVDKQVGASPRPVIEEKVQKLIG